jgi:hypothetical protein
VTAAPASLSKELRVEHLSHLKAPFNLSPSVHLAMGNSMNKITMTMVVWTLPEGENIVLEHNTTTGLRKVTLPSRNDEVLHQSTKSFDTGSVHFLEVHSKQVIVTIETNYLSFKYNLSCDGKRLPSHLEKLNVVQEDYSFSVTGYEIKDVGKEKVVFYTVTTKSYNKGRIEGTANMSGAVVGKSSHRYSSFDDLFMRLHSMFGASHLAQSIPVLPGKGLKITTDHLSTEFIEKRKSELNDFMVGIASFPGVMNVPGLLTFVGIEEGNI